MEQALISLTSLRNVFAPTLLIIALMGTAQAQNTHFDELPLNGLAAFEQLRKEYYIGALYLQSLNQDASSTFNFSGKKRMDIRITIDKWSPRRFAQQWNQQILINNDQESQNQFTDQILAFIDLAKDDLVAGDRITIDLEPNVGTTVYLNNTKVFTETDNAFFEVLLNTWIGQRPPSSDFKSHILTLPTDQAGTNLLIRYEGLHMDKARQKLAADWFKPKPNLVTDNPTTKNTNSSVRGAPPSSESTVTAKRNIIDEDVAQLAATVKAATPTTASKTKAIPTPELTLEKPQLAAAPAAPTKNETAKMAPAPAPVKPTAAKPAAPTVDTKAAEEQRLLDIYRSNVLKLTYLNTQYPKRAMDFKQEGRVTMVVKVNRNGELLDISEEVLSEHNMLNSAARRAIKKTAPYPEIPNGISATEVEIPMPFNFKL
ncbi:MAG: TonB family protein [Spongiibacteraceae bacterium]